MAYLTSSDIKDYGGIPASDTVDDTELAAIITRAQKYIEEYTGRVFQCDSSAETARYFSIDDVEGQTLHLDKDLNTLVSIIAGTDTIASTSYVMEPRNDKPYFGITLKQNSAAIWTNTTSDGDYENAITVTGQWAYSSDVPGDIKQEMLRLVKWYYKQGRVTDETADRPIVSESGAVIMPSQIPADITEVLDRYRRLDWRA